MKKAFLFIILTGTLNAWAGPKAPKLTEKLKKLGAEAFKTSCVACHGEKGDGKGPAAVAISGAKPRDFTSGVFKYGSKPEEIFKTITEGSKGTAMPPWSALKEEERWALAYYVLSLGKK